MSPSPRRLENGGGSACVPCVPARECFSEGMGKWRSTYQSMLFSKQSVCRSTLLGRLVGTSNTNLSGLVEPLTSDSAVSSPNLQTPGGSLLTPGGNYNLVGSGGAAEANGLPILPPIKSQSAPQPVAAAAAAPVKTMESSSARVLQMEQVIFNLVNIILGAGVLSMPYAMRQSGYATLLAMAAVIYITSLTGKWLASALEIAASSPEAEGVPLSAMDYGFLAKMAFGNWGLSIIGWVTILELWLATVTFLVMNGVNMHVVHPSLDARLTVPVTGLLAMLFCFVPPKVFSYLSLVSTFAMVTALACLVAAALTMGYWDEPQYSLGLEKAFFQPWNLPRSIGIITFCFAGHPVFPSVHASMKTTSKWNLSVDISFAVAFAYYGVFGFLGYLVFGTGVDPTITNNLVTVRGGDLWRVLAAACFIVKLNLTLPMMFSALLVALCPPQSNSSLWPVRRVLALLGVILITILVALAFQDAVAIVTSLSGNLFIMATSVLFPAAAHLRLSCKSGASIETCAKVKYGVVLSFGIIFGVLGTAFAVTDLWEKMRS